MSLYLIYHIQKQFFVPNKYWSEYANIHINYNIQQTYTTLQMFKVNKIFLNKLILPFSKDALNWFTKLQ